MTRPIQKLPLDVIGKIAAGEVVERPAAAVKELVENAIDAQATAITVDLRDGGITSIRVTDNGTGIPAGQMKMAFERHATSKLMTADELFDVHTLGFRGEALASIAAVSRVSCTSKTTDADYGMKAQVEAGRFVDFEEAASPVGTTFIVRDLFFNAPVRLKFLKKPAAEAALVSDYLMRLILSRADIAFRFVSQGKTIYRSTGDGKLESAIYAVYGREAAESMHKVSGHSGGVLIDGYVGVQELSRGNRQLQSMFINGRYFRDERLSKALQSATEGFVMIGRFPICALNLTLPYDKVDVNVHPNKLEVRFQNSAAVEDALEAVVREALQGEMIQTKLTAQTDEPKQTKTQIDVVPLAENTDELRYPLPETIPQLALHDSVQTLPDIESITNQPVKHELFVDEQEPDISEDEKPEFYQAVQEGVSKEQAMQITASPNTVLSEKLAQDNEEVEPLPSEPVQQEMPEVSEDVNIRYIGAAFHTYLIFESGEKLLLIDQHAAHERILYDRFMRRFQDERVSQRLLTPMLFAFTAKDVNQIMELKDELIAIGFDLDALDATSVAVRAVPVILGETDSVRELLIDVLDDVQGKANKATEDRMKQRVTQMACKHAIKGGDPLTDSDVEALIRQMLDGKVQPTCPHGRPIVQEMTKYELEKRFKRIQS